MRDCGCPSRLSYNTVDSYIGKLRAIFHATGRDGEWDRRLCLGNPATDQQVKDYLRLVTAEQLQARIQPIRGQISSTDQSSGDHTLLPSFNPYPKVYRGKRPGIF